MHKDSNKTTGRTDSFCERGKRRRENIKGRKITQGQPPSVVHSAAKQKTKKAGEKLISSLSGGNVGNLECKRLSTVCISLEKRHLLRVCLEKKLGGVF